MGLAGIKTGQQKGPGRQGVMGLWNGVGGGRHGGGQRWAGNGIGGMARPERHGDQAGSLASGTGTKLEAPTARESSAAAAARVARLKRATSCTSGRKKIVSVMP